MSPKHVHIVQVYYEDTDFTGVVYHANYLKYFERAREHMLGISELVRLHREQGMGFVVYRAELTYKEGAVHGDTLEVRTQAQAASAYRAVFQQEVYRVGGDHRLVHGTVELVCVNQDQKLVMLPETVRALLRGDEAGAVGR